MIRVAVIMGKMHAGGKKNLVMEYYRHLNRDLVQFDFFCDSDSNSIPTDEIEGMGGRIYIIPPYQKVISNMMAMKRLFMENQYTILHGYNSTMNVFAMFVGMLCKIPVRINESISMGHKDDKKNKLKNFLKLFSRCFSTHYASNGESCGRWQFGDRLFNEGKVKVFKTVIDTEKNKYDPELRNKCRKEFHLGESLVIGHIGRFTAQKNTLFVIDVFHEITKLVKDAKLVIIGHGELEEKMMEAVERYNIKDSVLNLRKREDINQFYNAMDCFLLPSLYEGLPVVGIEAECHGLPIFFSTEIPAESSPCNDLGTFIGLDKTADEWAKRIVERMSQRQPRKDQSERIKHAGFDSKTEGKKLGDYYCQLYNEHLRITT